MQGWEIWMVENGRDKYIDTVYFVDDMTEEDVYRALVDYDGFAPEININKET